MLRNPLKVVGSFTTRTPGEVVDPAALPPGWLHQVPNASGSCTRRRDRH